MLSVLNTHTHTYTKFNLSIAAHRRRNTLIIINVLHTVCKKQGRRRLPSLSCVLFIPFEKKRKKRNECLTESFHVAKELRFVLFLCAAALGRADFRQQDYRMFDQEEPFPPSLPPD